MNSPDSQTDYAFWTIPGTSFTVTYSLRLFQEIDFEVNEGYRRIPHGGVEVGGVLWGRVQADAVVIEAFRPIECEHALGPSFVLSERDLALLKEQLAGGIKDPDLAGLTAVGWFVARTRTALMMLDRDAALFDQLFPSPGSVTLLVKPERFQPTRFAFVARSGNGQVDRGTAQHAVILPLAGRPSQPAVAPVPSIAAPVQRDANQRDANQRDANQRDVNQRDVNLRNVDLRNVDLRNVDLRNVDLRNVDLRNVEPQSVDPQKTTETPTMPLEEPQPGPVMPLPAAPPSNEGKPVEDDAPQLPPRERQAVTRRRPEVRTEADLLSELAPVAHPQPIHAPAPLPSIDEVKRRRAEMSSSAEVSDRLTSSAGRTGRTTSGTPSGLGFITVLLLAAVLGCGAGYLAYLQLPAAIIQMDVQRQRTTLIVFWPAKQTESASYSAIRVDDGPAVPLTEEQKASGHMEINSTSDNVKVELIAQHWIRDSRGIVRYVRRTSPASSHSADSAPSPTDR